MHQKESATWRIRHWKLSSEKEKKKKEKKSEESLWELWDIMKRNNICIMGISEGDEEEKGIESIFKAFMFKVIIGR